MRKAVFIPLCILCSVCSVLCAQTPVRLGAGSYASFAPLAESRSALHDGCQAYQTEHRPLWLPDSLLSRLAPADASADGSLALPSNDWWTYALVNTWTGKLWFYPGWAEAKDGELQIGFPSYWEPTGCEVKWDTPLSVAFTNTATGQKAAFTGALVDSWSDFMVSFIMQDGEAWVRVTCMQGSPLVWIETVGITAQVSNPQADRYAVFASPDLTTVALLTDGLDAAAARPFAQAIPRRTQVDYEVNMSAAQLTTTFRVYTEQGLTQVLMAFLPHHYFSDEDRTGASLPSSLPAYLSPRGEMRLTQGNNFSFNYPIYGFLPFFPAPVAWADGFSAGRMDALNAAYAASGTFGADTYWGGKGLTQMMHYMTFALQTGDTATCLQAMNRLRAVLEDWYTYTPGEPDRYFARFPRWGAMVGFDTSYDSETFNDHHFHYGYFIYASAVLCMLDSDFKSRYGAMAREVAMDYACWLRDSNRYPLFRTFNPYCGHSLAGGLGNGGNGNGQESSSEAMQAWGGVWLLGEALGDTQMINAGIFGYTVEAKATAEYWFDRKRRNIDYTKYTHPYCCNLTMQGVGWWTWFSGDPVWMHAIQWLPVSPVLTNYFSQDRAFTRWDYAQMYAAKHIGDYETEQGGLGDESGLGNVCLSYLSLSDADSAARVWDRMDAMGKPLAKNPDTGGITYWLIHSHRSLGEKRFDILAGHAMACAYTDTLTGVTTYAAYNASDAPLSVRFFGAQDTVLSVPANALLLAPDDGRPAVVRTPPVEHGQTLEPDPMAWDLSYPNLALHKPVTVSSFENAGCVAANLTDGDPATRWGSAHSDNEYAVVDLGETAYIDHIVLRWETAYASRYELAFSDDNENWRTLDLTSSGGVETIPNSRLLFSGDDPLSRSRTRYIRITGLERATVYGTSLYELEAYGRPLTGDPSRVFTVALSAADTVLTQGQSTLLTTTAYNCNGLVMAVSSEQIAFPDYGVFTVTRSVDNCSASLVFVVLETEQEAGVVVQPGEVTIPVGSTQDFVITLVNQFGGSIDTCNAAFFAEQPADTVLTFDCFGRDASALVHARPYSEFNLALGRPAYASGMEGEGTAARFAVDGDTDTRWSSRFMDNEWIAVDLQDCYRLVSVVLRWENAYASDFDIDLSGDGENYTTALSVTDAEGGVQTYDIRSNGQPVEARFVRIFCRTRNTGYGSSLWEIEVYGEAPCASPQTSVPLTPADSTAANTASKYIRNGQILILRNGTYFNALGHPVR